MSTTETAASDLATPLDLLLTSAVAGPVRRMLPGSSWARFAVGLAGRPRTVVRRTAGLAAELTAVAVGTSERTAGRRDRRFADPAWTQNPWLRRAMQAYLAGAETAQVLLGEVDLDWRDRERLDFALGNIVDALAPTNSPLLNPLAWKAVIDTGGTSVLTGTRNLVADLAAAPRVPAMVERDAFSVGEDLGVTPGAVVLRTPVFELIEYAPQTKKVRAVPLVVVPPVINKYYVADLAPGRSMIEFYVQQGHRVFAISWRNPDARHRQWDADAYGAAILEAFAAARRVSGAQQNHVLSICSGGILTAMVLGHLAHVGKLDQIATHGLAVAVLDSARSGLASAVADERLGRAAIASSQARGYLDGRTLAEIFAWLRPNDLVWSYWVNNYLQGRQPAAFDVLYWNADTTRMAAGLHRDFIELSLSNDLVTPGAATMLGSPVDLRAVDVPTYVVAGSADHISRWQSCYRSTQLLGGECRFVLSSNGHVASMVNPPTNARSSWLVSPEGAEVAHPADPEEWLAGATSVEGSWWPDYTAWLAERGGPLVAAPAGPGGGGLSPIEPAPGSYVHER